MKTKLVAISLAALFLCGCPNPPPPTPNGSPTPSPISPFEDALITDGVSVAVSTTLGLIKDTATRTLIKNYLQGYAPGLRTITSNPTPAQLAALITQYTPANIQQQFPQIVAFASPLIINAIEYAISKYGTDAATVTHIVNDVATGLEIGAGGSVSSPTP
jgi:hypothetical protein